MRVDVRSLTMSFSPSLSPLALERRPQEQAIFRSLMQRTMSYVLEKLSGKGVFHNTLMFAGRMLGKHAEFGFGYL
jgi:hypothetical protein